MHEAADYHPFRSAEARTRYLTHYDLQAERWPVPSETAMAETSFGSTLVRASGPEGAPPLVLLPGMGSHSLVWLPNIQAMSQAYRTYAVDSIYDYGRSVYRRPVRSADDYVAWLEELFTALGLADGAHLMGLSYGGWLASRYALEFPERLHKMVWLAPAATVQPVRLQFYLRLALCLLPYRVFLQRFAHWQARDTVESGEAGLAEVEAAVDQSMLTRSCFKPFRTVPPTVLTDEELGRIQTPTLCLLGENETLYSAQRAKERLSRMAPQIRCQIIPNAGHDLGGVQAELVNRTILAFLES